uniref:GPI ethanolamine phosphate transferase 1 n=1 Tax=Clastoptera arizonana TaxID=38151 RepID=A0A1B6CUA4_9HEMI
MFTVIFGFLIHLVFLLSIFDIYFKSPIIHGIPSLINEITPPSKRLVLFLTDGLRADSFFSWDLEDYRPTYLRSIINYRGVWGVSHTRVPTESRPGHVALIAGIYEDPSAVFKGWKENPVEFDSVFNRSTVTYSWGSPDILSIFSKGAPEGKIHTFAYSSDSEDFSGRNNSASFVSIWVFQQVEEFFKKAEHNEELKSILFKQGIVFFLHLLGPDIAGHANKPHSIEYKENILVIDKGVEKIENIINNFYNDNKTAFILTADHGMTDWGSHGAGTAHETETPLVMWGAGVAKPHKTESNMSKTPQHWRLGNVVRHDINQADLVPVMATMLGLSIPVNSVGVMPAGLLNLSYHDSSLALSQNAFQMASHYGRKRDLVKSGTLPLLYRHFPQMHDKEEDVMKNNIGKLIREKKFTEANVESKRLLELSLLGLDYYHNYYQGLLLGCVTLSFMGWILWLCCLLLPEDPLISNKNLDTGKQNNEEKLFKPIVDIFFAITHIIAVILIFVQSLPLQYYVYCCLPIWLWWIVGRKVKLIFNSIRFMKIHPIQLVASGIVGLIGLELLAFSFYYRGILSVIMCALSLWPLGKCEVPKLLQLSWFISSLVLAVFPALPTVGSEIQIHLVYICGWLWLTVGILIAFLMKYYTKDYSLKVSLIKLTMFPITIWVIYSTSNSFSNKHGLPLLNQLLSWAFLVISLIQPFISSTLVLPRLSNISLAFAVPYLFLCTGHEAFFLLAIFINLFIWLILEVIVDKNQQKILTSNFQNVSEDNDRSFVTLNDFRRSSFFLIYVIVSFFGTGNIASINSFDPVWVRCFLTVFSPFTMTLLIVCKTIIPLFLVSCTFRAINIITKTPIQYLLIIVLILSDIMGLHFLYAVKNKGSWLDIGTSISHYVIVQCLTLFIVVLYGIATIYTNYSLINNQAPKDQSLESKPSHIQVINKKRHYD